MAEQFCLETRPDPCGLIIFGASGDLAERKLFPALYELFTADLLPGHFFALGAGRTALTDETFRDRVASSLAKAGKSSGTKLSEFLSLFHYCATDYADAKAYPACVERLKSLDKSHQTRGNRLFYMAVPPSIYETIVEQLGRAGLSKERSEGLGWSRIIVEKPFGHDAAGARTLTEKIRRHFEEDQIYRMDHYLGKETVQGLLVLRFANVLFEPLWNRNYVDHVQITVAEDSGVGHRAGYYEEAGALRDMFQNHLLQLLCVAAMEPPASFAAERVRDEKSKLLRAARPLSYSTLGQHAVRAQYGAGVSGGKPVPAYRQETGVAPDSRVETFAALKVFVDNWRWQGVPFYLRSGKRMKKRESKIVIQFRHVPHLLFEPLKPQDLRPNVLTLRLQPQEGVSLCFETKAPGPKMCMSSVTMNFNYENVFGTPPEAYGRLFLDAMAGDQTLFTRSDWVDLSWNFLAPVLESWKSAPPPPVYEAGGWGPTEADALISPQGHAWRND
jgi:glucose-6-phosphate 1-dehydrogenase